MATYTWLASPGPDQVGPAGGTAHLFGQFDLTLRARVLARADEVIE
jgi:hypothetical protein